MLDRLTSMEVLVKVADLGNLSAAARDLGMSQAMASKHIAALEQRLQVPLLTRSTRRMSLTEAGQLYLLRAREILSQFDEAESLVGERREKVTGRLRVSLPVSFGLRCLAPLIADFSRLYPDLILDLSFSDRRVDLLTEGWDLAVRITKMQDSSLMARKLAPCPMAVAASPSYLAKHGRPRRLTDLAAHACLGYTLGSADAGVWEFGGAERHRVAVRGPLRADNGDALVAAAVGGLGLIYQPRFLLAEALAAGQLEELELDQPAQVMDGVFAVYPATRHPEAKLRAFIDYLVVALRS